ncbi:MAG: cysteine hydrolase family protein [Granulosicoccus sp.]
MPAVQSRQDRWSWHDGTVSLVRSVPPAQIVTLNAEPDPVRVDLAQCAMVIIDMQNDFLDSAGWFASARGAAVSQLSIPITPINTLSQAFRQRGVPVIHLNWGVRADLANLPANVIDKGSACGRQVGYGDRLESGTVLVRDSWGASSVPGIEQHTSDLTIFKHRLSGFQDNELEQVLRRLGITTVFYTGVNLDRCVFATLMDGCFQGFDAILVKDATATVSPESVGDAIIYLIQLLYGFTTHSDAILSALDNDKPKVENT